MNAIKKLTLVGLAVTLILPSCTIEKRVHMAGYNVQWKKGKTKLDKKELAQNHVQQDEGNQRLKLDELKTSEGSANYSVESEINESETNASLENKLHVSPEISLNDGLKESSEEVDIYEKSSKVNVAESKLRSDAIETEEEKAEPKVEGLGLAGFIIGIVGWFMPFGLGLVMCILAIIFGAISMGKIKNNPEKFKGKGFAITSLIVGIVGVGLLLLLI